MISICEVTKSSGTLKEDTQQWPPYYWLESPEIRPIVDDFWRVKYDEHDLALYDRFVRILGLSRGGHNGEEIGRILHMNNVRAFLAGRKKSFLTHLRSEHERLGTPELGCCWLPIQLKPRGTPGREWIQVPSQIKDLRDIASVIGQRSATESVFSLKDEFGYNSREELAKERMSLFGFLVGAVIGDVGKHRKGESRFPSKSLSLVLSKDKPNSFRFGQFTTLCARASIGLEMHRIADSPVSKHRFSKAECFQWISPASPLVGWLFHGCLGLQTGELTTYNPMRMDWLLDTPSSFKAAVLQGISESDGWVDAGDDTICIVSSPNSALLSSVLDSLNLRHRTDHQELVDVLRVPTEEGAKLPLFNPRIRSVYFEQMEIMSHAWRLPDRKRLPDEIIQYIRELSIKTQTLSGICLELAKTRGVKVTSQTIRKYIGKGKRKKER